MCHLAGVVDNEEGCVDLGGAAGDVREIPVPSFQLCCGPKTALEK